MPVSSLCLLSLFLCLLLALSIPVRVWYYLLLVHFEVSLPQEAKMNLRSGSKVWAEDRNLAWVAAEVVDFVGKQVQVLTSSGKKVIIFWLRCSPWSWIFVNFGHSLGIASHVTCLLNCTELRCWWVQQGIDWLDTTGGTRVACFMPTWSLVVSGISMTIKSALACLFSDGHL